MRCVTIASILVMCGLYGCTSTTKQSEERFVVAPLIEPTRFRFETVLFEMPLSVAESLFTSAAADDRVLNFAVDEQQSREQLESLAHSSPGIIRAPRASITAQPREQVRVPTRVASPEQPASSLASDALQLDVRALDSSGWAPFELELALVWHLPDGAAPVLFKASSPVPKGHWMRMACLPAKNAAGEGNAPQPKALVAFIDTRPIFDQLSQPAELAAGELLECARGILRNTGKVAIHYRIDGERNPAEIDLGDAGRASWEGHQHRFAVHGGARCALVCNGDRNTIDVVMGDAKGGGEVACMGSANTVRNVNNSFGKTLFRSEPKPGHPGNHLDFGDEGANKTSGPWTL